MSAIQRPGAIRDYFNIRETAEVATRTIQDLRAENAELRAFATELSASAPASDCVGLLAFGFVAGAVASSLLVGAVAVLS